MGCPSPCTVRVAVDLRIPFVLASRLATTTFAEFDHLRPGASTRIKLRSVASSTGSTALGTDQWAAEVLQLLGAVVLRLHTLTEFDHLGASTSSFVKLWSVTGSAGATRLRADLLTTEPIQRFRAAVLRGWFHR